MKIKLWRASYLFYLKAEALIQKEMREEAKRKDREAGQKEYGKTYKLAHSEQIRNSRLAYYRTSKGKEAGLKKNAARKQFGFIPLNNWFEGSAGHHIDRERVIYIPARLHNSIRHSLITNYNMGIINNLAMEFISNV